MKTWRMLVVTALAWLAALPAQALVEDTAYAATRSVRLDGREVATQVNHTRLRERISANGSGVDGTVILRSDRNIAWQLMPQMGIYAEADVSRMDTPANIRIVSSEPLGEETVAGQSAMKYRAVFQTRNGGQHQGYFWQNKAGVHVKQQFPVTDRNGRTRQVELELRDLKVGAQDPALFEVPDAGLWEFRGRAEVHTYTAAMCWAACDRLAKIASRLGLEDRVAHWRERADRIHATTLARAWRADANHFSASFQSDYLDASLLLLADIGFVPSDDPRYVATVEAIGRELRHGDGVFRYVAPDDFGAPETSFTICTFWYIDALAAIGRRDEARALFERVLARRNRLGLLSEDMAFEDGEGWGNFPQTYSHVGLINAAMRLSRSWQEAS